jgi:uncharacterized membrane protein YdjX (TVP38/TMEM64 family)
MKKIAQATVAAVIVLVLMISPVRPMLARWIALLATGSLAQLQQDLRSLGYWGPMASISLMVAQALAIPVPVTILMVANGVVFGTWWGAIISLAGGFLGAFAAYAIGRWLGRGLIERLVPGWNISWADQIMSKYGGWAIVTNRWLPGVPLDPLSYAAGIARVPAVWFMGVTAAGLVPATLATAFLGAEIRGDLPKEFWISGLMFVVVAWLAWRLARRIDRRSTVESPI